MQGSCYVVFLYSEYLPLTNQFKSSQVFIKVEKETFLYGMAFPTAAAVLLNENMQIHKGEIIFPENYFATMEFHETYNHPVHVQETGLMHQVPNH